MKTLNNQHIILLFMVAASLLFGCRPKQYTTPAPELTISPPNIALSAMHSHHARFESLAARFAGTATWRGSVHNVSGSIRILHDKAIWISVAPIMGIEVSRVVVTPDSVKFLNRLEGTFFSGYIHYLNNLIGSNMDFFMLQSVLLGNDFSHFSNQDIEMESDRDMTRLNFSQRRRLNPSMDDFWISHNIWIDRKSFRIRQSNFALPQYGQDVQVQYQAIENIEGQHLPVKMQIHLANQAGSLQLSLAFTRIQLNTPVDLSFSVPARYRKIEM